MESMFQKFSAPTKFDVAPPGATWQAKLDSGAHFFIQVSPENQEMRWLRMEDFLLDAFLNYLIPLEVIEKNLENYIIKE